jgi:23S rRNA pseudouridine1911/1915/1917 synthase
MDNEQTTKLHFEVGLGSNKQKLGEFLFENVIGLSKMYLRELIKTGKCEVNGEHENSGYRLRPNDFVEVEADLSRGTAMQPQDIPLYIVYEDAHLIVINKPAGMLVHPTHRDKNGTLLNALTFYLNNEILTQRREAAKQPDSALSTQHSAFIRPGLVHRLDKQTSGLMVVAKTPAAHRRLSADFLKKRVEKRYLALVQGIVAEDLGSIVAPIGRYAELKHWSIKTDGKYSESRFWVRKRFSDKTLLELEPVTGRTNQLRIHCELLGHPIIGDVRRGGREFNRICLHAFKLSFPHPVLGERMEFQNDLPDGFPI